MTSRPETTSAAPRVRSTRRLVWGLVLLSPIVGEYLLGNVPVHLFVLMVVLMPMYGAGALLIRETARRRGLGWPGIVWFAAAYALVEEGLVNQLLFNPAYSGHDNFDGFVEIPGLGISLKYTLWLLAMHTVWSICVPIALVEAFDPDPSRPWLSRRGYVITALVFVVLGCVAWSVIGYNDFRFVGSPLQFAVTGAAVVGLIALGLRAGRNQPTSSEGGRAPRPLWVGLAAFALTSAHWMLTAPMWDGVWNVVVPVAAFAVAVTLGWWSISRWSRRPGWTGQHRVALAAGAAATYGTWFGPFQAMGIGVPPILAAGGALVVGGLVAFVAWRAYRAARRLADAEWQSRGTWRKSVPSATRTTL